MEKNKKQSKNDNYDKIFDAVMDFFLMYFEILKEAIKTKSWTKKENIFLFFSFVFATSIMIYNDRHLEILRYFTFSPVHPVIDGISNQLGIYRELIINLVLLFLIGMFFIGLSPYKVRRKYQKAIDNLRLKNGLDKRPKIIEVDNLTENRTRLLVKSHGLGQDRYKAKLDDIRASVGKKVESVKYFDKDNTFVEIYLAQRPLENIINYADVITQLNKPYSFVVGKSLAGLVIQDFANDSMPHCMIGGTTGGGKSNAYNNAVLSLLEKSDNLQMYLVDLKGGLEIKVYEGFKNVELVKNIQDASILLKKLVDEMERRYQYLEEEGYKKIDPKRDKLNRIIIAVDECTDLLGKVPRDHVDYPYIVKAIEYMDKLARKARAAGIHILLATQKIDKSSIPTRIQEMMTTRLALRVKTMENSIRLIGNRMAYDLPAVPGRSIWSVDSDFKEVQVPFISDDVLKQRVEKIKEEIENGTKKNFSNKLRTLKNETKTAEEEKKEFVTSSEEGKEQAEDEEKE